MYVCPNHCEAELYYPPCCLRILDPSNTEADPSKDVHPELGVICDAEGELSNRWEDGTVGVPEFLVDDDCPPACCECKEESEWVDK